MLWEEEWPDVNHMFSPAFMGMLPVYADVSANLGNLEVIFLDYFVTA